MKKIFASLIILILILFNVSPVLAADPTPAPAAAPTPAPTAPATPSFNPAAPTKHKFLLNVPIGKLVDFEIDANAGNNGSDILGRYIQAWYGFLLGTIGIMATVMIMWGGFKYLTSRGDKGVIDTAKAQIISAITGVALAFGTYSILMLINPQLLTITMPNLPGLQGGENVKLEQAKIYAAEGRSDYPSSTGRNNPANLSNTPQIQGVSPRTAGESGAAALSRNAHAALGQPIGSTPETLNGQLGCALAVDQIVHASGLGSGGFNLGVTGLYDELSNNGNFESVTISSPADLRQGDVVMSFGGTRAHTGIVTADGSNPIITSNSSSNGTFSWNATYNDWVSYYTNPAQTFHVLRPK